MTKRFFSFLGAAVVLSIGAVAASGCQLILGIGGECPLEPTDGGAGGAGGTGATGGTGGTGGGTTTGTQGGGGTGGVTWIPLECVGAP